MSAELLTVAAVANELGTSKRFVHDELRAGNLRGIKLSGRAGWRIYPADLETYLQAKANVRPVRKAAS